MFSLEDKFALVTGGSSGIGRAIVARFRAAGAKVMVADRHEPEDPVPFVRTDVSRETDVVAMFDAAVERFGRVDILVNNAGIQPLGVGMGSVTPALLERTFAVKVHGGTD